MQYSMSSSTVLSVAVTTKMKNMRIDSTPRRVSGFSEHEEMTLSIRSKCTSEASIGVSASGTTIEPGVVGVGQR
jgi:hypothetical protein